MPPASVFMVKPAPLTFAYNLAAVAGVDRVSLRVAKWNPAHESWTIFPPTSSADQYSYFLPVQTGTPGIYAITAALPAAS